MPAGTSCTPTPNRRREFSTRVAPFDASVVAEAADALAWSAASRPTRAASQMAIRGSPSRITVRALDEGALSLRPDSRASTTTSVGSVRVDGDVNYNGLAIEQMLPESVDAARWERLRLAPSPFIHILHPPQALSRNANHKFLRTVGPERAEKFLAIAAKRAGETHVPSPIVRDRTAFFASAGGPKLPPLSDVSLAPLAYREWAATRTLRPDRLPPLATQSPSHEQEISWSAESPAAGSSGVATRRASSAFATVYSHELGHQSYTFVGAGGCVFDGTLGDDGAPHGPGVLRFEDGAWMGGVFVRGELTCPDGKRRWGDGATYSGPLLDGEPHSALPAALVASAAAVPAPKAPAGDVSFAAADATNAPSTAARLNARVPGASRCGVLRQAGRQYEGPFTAGRKGGAYGIGHLVVRTAAGDGNPSIECGIDIPVCAEYAGEWLNDVYHGRGVFLTPDDAIYGNFSRGVPVGDALVIRRSLSLPLQLHAPASQADAVTQADVYWGALLKGRPQGAGVRVRGALLRCNQWDPQALLESLVVAPVAAAGADGSGAPAAAALVAATCTELCADAGRGRIAHRGYFCSGEACCHPARLLALCVLCPRSDDGSSLRMTPVAPTDAGAAALLQPGLYRAGATDDLVAPAVARAEEMPASHPLFGLVEFMWRRLHENAVRHRARVLEQQQNEQLAAAQRSALAAAALTPSLAAFGGRASIKSSAKSSPTMRAHNGGRKSIATTALSSPSNAATPLGRSLLLAPPQPEAPSFACPQPALIDALHRAGDALLRLAVDPSLPIDAAAPPVMWLPRERAVVVRVAVEAVASASNCCNPDEHQVVVAAITPSITAFYHDPVIARAADAASAAAAAEALAAAKSRKGKSKPASTTLSASATTAPPAPNDVLDSTLAPLRPRVLVEESGRRLTLTVWCRPTPGASWVQVPLMVATGVAGPTTEVSGATPPAIGGDACPVRAEAAAAAQLLSAAQRAPIPDLSVLTVRRVIQSAFVQMRDRLSASLTAAVTAAALQVPTSTATDVVTSGASSTVTASGRTKEAKAALAAYDASILVLPHSDLVAPDDAPTLSALGPLHQAVQTLRATPPKGCVLAMSAECTVAHGVAEFPAVLPLVLADRAASAVQAEIGMRALARRAVAQLKSAATATTPGAKKGAATSTAVQTAFAGDVVGARDAAAEAAAVAVLNGGAQFEMRIGEFGEADGTSHQVAKFDGCLVLPFQLFAADV